MTRGRAAGTGKPDADEVPRRHNRAAGENIIDAKVPGLDRIAIGQAARDRRIDARLAYQSQNSPRLRTGVPAGLAWMMGPAFDRSRVKKIAPTYTFQSDASPLQQRQYSSHAEETSHESPAVQPPPGAWQLASTASVKLQHGSLANRDGVLRATPRLSSLKAVLPNTRHD